jgi:hypothetical protein
MAAIHLLGDEAPSNVATRRTLRFLNTGLERPAYIRFGATRLKS